MKSRAPENIDEYIDGFPSNVQKILQKIRKTIQKAAPQAQEVISYQMPAFKLKRVFVYFAGYQNHLSLYPAPRGVAEFQEELAQYEGGKGTVQFPLGQPVNFDLIARIVKYRMKENAGLENARGRKKVGVKKKAGSKKTSKKKVAGKKTSKKKAATATAKKR
jgi:uncharacterized protein YdhG (YjbR/CyaY superfamily)